MEMLIPLEVRAMGAIDRETIRNDDTVALYWYAKARVVEVVSKRGAAGQEFRGILEFILAVVNDRRAAKVLADTSKMDKVPDEDMLWTVTDWWPRLAKAGVKAIATVPPKSLAAHLSMDKAAEIMPADGSGMKKGYFADAVAARVWLEKQ